ncbi:tyrosine-type recombinase/integrase (plasmid) [Mycolicibacterium fluoranthenivorans]|uniref:Tyrosine-type recombinase/integrase n=2 Tax=Mycolicibacterium fluoranthenivorans TaxID=258505 RepID=A0A7G8P6S6_9MYCO|nr:tyrosine-type recombinase/integrase [Mycolicibacterium fluoranthenivorans]
MTTDTAAIATIGEYLGLSPEQRYDEVSRHFPPWLLLEPIEFPAHHATYGWACRVEGCEATISATRAQLLCEQHGKLFRQVEKSTSLEEFIRGAKPFNAQSFGWALSRRADCKICGPNREAHQHDYCQRHANSMRLAKQHWINETTWRQTQHPLPVFAPCLIERCVHDGELHARVGSQSYRLCRSHFHDWAQRSKSLSGTPDEHGWDKWFSATSDGPSVTPVDRRGQLSVANLPISLQREIRYAIHRHANTARRTHWRPTALQKIVDILAQAGLESVTDPRVLELATNFERGSMERRILLDLPVATRSLMITEGTAKAAGWFDPIIVGSSPFPGTQGAKNRRAPWDLTAVSQRWLRDLLWDYLRDEALKPNGKRPGRGTVHRRLSAVVVLSYILRHIRDDHGDDPGLLADNDARAVKEIWDLWFREQIPLPFGANDDSREPSVLNELSRHVHMSSIRIVLRHSRERRRTPPEMDLFILNLPEYSRPPRNPRPRPLTYGDFQLLVSPDSIASLENADREDVGLADMWLSQAFQGGRIGETLQLRLGCVGLVGNAQPYMWRDISKINVVDYGMPCYLPVYDRLLQRQQKTRAKLRRRYADQLAELDARGQTTLEAQWDREMPLFPGAVQNPDLVLEVSQSSFRTVWTEWFESLGLKGITTHQTRATLATSLLNNGAPAALVRQLLGHFSQESLAHYANYSNDSMTRHLQQVWAAGPGMDKPGTILLRPTDVNADDAAAAAARIDLTVIPVEHGLCRYGPVVGGANCPYEKNCSNGPQGVCEHFVLTGADLAYWERKRDVAYHFAEGAPTDEARDYILSQWHDWEPVLTALREAIDELGLLEEAERLDLRAPVHDYFGPLFSSGWLVSQLNPPAQDSSPESTTGGT